MKALEIEEKIRSDVNFSNFWHSINHKDVVEVGIKMFKANYEMSEKILNVFDSFNLFEAFKNNYDTSFVVNYGGMVKFYSLEVNWLFKFDHLSLTAAFTVLFVSFLVHLYSCDYMAGDAHAVRFFTYLSLFTFFMVMLVLSANMIVFYIAWEGVGLFSFLLISFWFTRAQANKAALKALLINKIGDVFLLLAAAHTFNLCDSLDFDVIFSVGPIEGQRVFSEFFNLSYTDVMCLLLVMASFVKSAQLFFHV